MLGRISTVCLIVMLTFAAAQSAQQGYVSGRIVDLQQGSRDCVQLYLVNTPILTEDSYVTFAVDVNGKHYEGEFLPGNRHELFPGLWKTHEPVPTRIEKHFLYLKREDGSEAKFLILSKSPRGCGSRVSVNHGASNTR